VDGTNSNTASLILSYGGQIIAKYSTDAMGRQQNGRVLTRSPNSAVNASVPQVTARSRVWFNPTYTAATTSSRRGGQHYYDGDLMLTALAIVREKEIGTMEQLMVTPLRPMELMLARRCRSRGRVSRRDPGDDAGSRPLPRSFQRQFPVAVVLLPAIPDDEFGAGLFISTISHTQQQAMMSSFFFSMPAFMLSGFAFPIRNMPLVVQYSPT